MATDQPLEVHENVQNERHDRPDGRAYVPRKPRRAPEPAKYEIGETLWLRTAVCNMPVTVTDRYLDPTGKWKYQVEDSNGELYNNGEYLTQDVLKR